MADPLSNVGAAPPIAEAKRILRGGGTLVICDADFAKSAMGVEPGNSLGSCADAFVATAVTEPQLAGKLKPLAAAHDLSVIRFSVRARVVSDGPGSLVWGPMGAGSLVAQG